MKPTDLENLHPGDVLESPSGNRRVRITYTHKNGTGLEAVRLAGHDQTINLDTPIKKAVFAHFWRKL